MVGLTFTLCIETVFYLIFRETKDITSFYVMYICLDYLTTTFFVFGIMPTLAKFMNLQRSSFIKDDDDSSSSNSELKSLEEDNRKDKQ